MSARTPLWSRRSLLLAGSGLFGGLGWLPGHARADGPPRHLLIWWNSGGWDPTFVFDPHFDSDIIQFDPASEPSSSAGLQWASAASRPSVDTFFARHAGRTAIINGLGVGSISHEGCATLLLTGQRLATAPDIAAILAAETGAELLLPYLSLSGPKHLGSLGHSMTPMFAETAGLMTGSHPRSVSVDADREALISSYLAEVAAGASTGPMTAHFQQALERIEALKPVAGRLALPASPDASDRLAVAVEGLAAGLSRVVMLEAPLANQVAWDSHIDNTANQEGAYESSFAALNQLLDTLSETDGPGGLPLIDTTTVMVASEMGRTPVENAMRGKDHWPTTSLMLLGAGVRGGQVFGATTDSLVGDRIDLRTGQRSSGGVSLTPAHLLAGLMASFDVDPTHWLPGIEPFLAPWEGLGG